MPERGFATETWDSDEWFQEKTRDQRYLFIYTWTNNHCNQAGLYHITLTTIANETKFSKGELPELLESLSEKVKWYPEQNLIWVKNFIKRQSRSSKFLAAAAKSLTTIRNNGAIQELLEYNRVRYSISIPYQYYIDRISIPYGGEGVKGVRGPDTVPDSDSGAVKGAGVVKGEGETEVAPKGAGDSHRAEGDAAIISTWRSVTGWNLSPDEELELLARVKAEFADMNLLAESQTWAARKIKEPLKSNSKPPQQIWNWMRKGRQFAQERREREQGKDQRAKVHPREDYRRPW